MKFIPLFVMSVLCLGFFQHGCGNTNKANQPLNKDRDLIVATATSTPMPESVAQSSNQMNGASEEEAGEFANLAREGRREAKERCKNKPIGRIEATPPSSDFRTRYVPFTMTFDGGKSYDPNGKKIVKWEWNFGDGQTGDGKVVTHTYIKPSNLTVVLTVTNSSGEISLDCSNGYEQMSFFERDQ